MTRAEPTFHPCSSDRIWKESLLLLRLYFLLAALLTVLVGLRHSSSSRHSHTCPARSPSTPMHAPQPCWHSKKERLNRGWSPNSPELGCAVWFGTGAESTAFRTGALLKRSRGCWAADLWKAGAVHGCVESRVQEHGRCIISESDTGDSNENKLLQETFWKLWLCSNVAAAPIPCVLCLAAAFQPSVPGLHLNTDPPGQCFYSFCVPVNSTLSCPDNLVFPLSDYLLLTVTNK